MSSFSIENNPSHVTSSLVGPFPHDAWDPELGLSPQGDPLSPEYVTSVPLVNKDTLDGMNFSDFYQNDTVRLDLLLKILQERDRNMTKYHHHGKYFTSSMDLVVVQLSLLAILVSIALCWACCFKRRIIQTGATGPNVLSSRISNLARKISGLSFKDLPPNYSRVDLTTFGLSIDDHLNPPPHYEIALQSRNVIPMHTSIQEQCANGTIVPNGASGSPGAVGWIPEHPILVINPKTRKISTVSLPASALINPNPTGQIVMDRRISIQPSDTFGRRSRRVSFFDGPRSQEGPSGISDTTLSTGSHVIDMDPVTNGGSRKCSRETITIPEEEDVQTEPNTK
ncbi:uncharacterized protein LOC131889875 [Tigriopus californicus]|uniref:uncharacterized protein LOC131889875 n=1 Tax=Tigriopus californicus TaxID=6832 RepID=UPI0027DA6FA7|nr:uncharacterized protein LOC131889875 [Tigriopus californicus]